RTLAVAEHLRFEESFRQCRAIDRDEGAARATTVEVNELRDHLLAAAALACDEHRRIGWRHLAGEVDRPAKRRRGPEQRDLVGRGLPASLSVLLLTRLARHEQRMHGAS